MEEMHTDTAESDGRNGMPNYEQAAVTTSAALPLTLPHPSDIVWTRTPEFPQFCAEVRFSHRLGLTVYRVALQRAGQNPRMLWVRSIPASNGIGSRAEWLEVSDEDATS